MFLGNVANEIVLRARSYKGKIAKYKPTHSGQCQELVDKVLNESNAIKGPPRSSAQKGDIITFNGWESKIDFTITAITPGRRHLIDELSTRFSRKNHIAIVSVGPDRNGKIFIIEQNTGNTRKVVESPLNTKMKGSYTQRFSETTSFAYFKEKYTSLLESEYTKEKSDSVINNPATWHDIKTLIDSDVKYSFLVSVSYTALGTIKYNRPQKLQSVDDFDL